MTSDDQHFLDHLHRASASLRSFAADLSDFASTTETSLTDAVTDAVADAVRSLNGSLGWALPVPASRAAAGAASGGGFGAGGGGAGRGPPRGVVDVVRRWVDGHRGVVVGLAAFLCTGAAGLVVLSWVAEREGRRRSRRARRARNGARKEVVVVAGTPGSRLVTTLARDLEKRGFVVYVVATSREEFLSVQAEGKPDIRPLAMDLVDLPRTDEAIEQFGRALQTPIQSSPMSSRHHLEFTGLVIAPDLVYPSGSALDLEPAIWQETFNVKVLTNVSATRAFLPLIIQHHSRILFVTPSIIQSLKPAYNAVESSLGCALEAYITSLQREMSEYDVHVSHIKLGAVDFTSPPLSGASSPARGLTRAHMAKFSGSKELQYAVFDALTMARPFHVRRVGRGSMAYDIIGKLMPGSLVQWMLQGLKAKNIDMAVPADDWQDIDERNKELIRSPES